jgi:hypothetical protein
MGWMSRVLGFDFWQELGIFLFTITSRMALGPTQPTIQWVPGAPSLEVKWSGCETDHSSPSSSEVKNVWSYTFTLPKMPSWHGAQLKKEIEKHKDNFTFTTTMMDGLIFLTFTNKPVKLNSNLK